MTRKGRFGMTPKRLKELHKQQLKRKKQTRTKAA